MWLQTGYFELQTCGNNGSISKVFDAIMADKLSSRLLYLVMKNQHGFVQNKSIVTNLINYSHYIAESLNEGNQVHLIYLDFAKAFDSVNHELFILKLFNLGLKGGTLKWISSYLASREQSVRIKGNFSDPFIANCGVPQGSHLGPLLFIIFINDISDVISTCEYQVYADDIKIYLEIGSIANQLDLQRDLDEIYRWSLRNFLRLNVSKCKALTFCRTLRKMQYNYTLNSVSLETDSNFKDLCIIFESNFEFKLNVETIAAKAFSLYGFIIRSTKEFRKNEPVIAIYRSLILSKFLFGSIIWSPYRQVNIHNLESVQHKFLRYVSFKIGDPMLFTNYNYNTIASTLNLPSNKIST